MISRCINIDWLEVYCLESNEYFPLNADFYIQHGFDVRQRDYGTRVWGEMFTIMGTDGERLLEVRRAPKARQAMPMTVFWTRGPATFVFVTELATIATL